MRKCIFSKYVCTVAGSVKQII